MKKLILITSASLLLSSAAFSNETFTFDGEVATSCTIASVTSTGTMASDGDFSFSSKNSGGSPAKLSITSNANVVLTATAELTSAPSGVISSGSFSANGGIGPDAVSSLNITGPLYPTQYDVHMEVAADDIIPAGSYSGTVTVTCTEEFADS